MHARFLFMRLFSVAAALVASASSSLATDAATTTTSSFIEFRSVDGKLLADNETFYIRGINWFGFGACFLYSHLSIE